MVDSHSGGCRSVTLKQECLLFVNATVKRKRAGPWFSCAAHHDGVSCPNVNQALSKTTKTTPAQAVEARLYLLMKSWIRVAAALVLWQQQQGTRYINHQPGCTQAMQSITECSTSKYVQTIAG
jgi:hypothetical protein